MSDEKKAAKPAGRRPDIASAAGLIVGFGGILAGLTLDGGKVRDVIQFNAAVVVFGGTLGAVMITTPMQVLIRAAKHIGLIFFSHDHSASATIDKIVEYAVQARKQGIVSLEQEASAEPNPFLRKALNLAVDGIDMTQIRDIMELQLSIAEQDLEAEAKVFEAAGGYAPTVGIIGAVLGLMQVMKDLSNIDAVGRGIAAAFVATVYGVASANLFFLPAASKLRALARSSQRVDEAILEGVLSIVEGLNPKLIRSKLEAFDVRKAPSTKEAKAAAEAQPSAAPAEG
jgi:chemotaxis protein MotA